MTEDQVKRRDEQELLLQAVGDIKLSHILLMLDPEAGMSTSIVGPERDLINMLGNVAIRKPAFLSLLKRAIIAIETAPKEEPKVKSRPQP